MKMWGINEVQFSGTVSKIEFSSTAKGKPCSTFLLSCETKEGGHAMIRVNIYNGLVNVCRQILREGDYAIVAGRLMNRVRKDHDKTQLLVEVRADRIVVPHSKRVDDMEDSDEWYSDEQS